MKIKTCICLILITLTVGVNILHAKKENRKFIIGYSGAPISVDYWKKLKDSLLVNAKKLDIVVIDFSSNLFTFEAQKESLMNAISLNVDGMIIGPVSDKTSKLMKEFKKHKIPVITVGAPLRSNWVTTSVVIENDKAAQIAGKYILQKLKENNQKANRILILCGDKLQSDALIRANIPYKMLKTAGYNVAVYYSNEWSGKNSLTDAINEYSQYKEEIVASFSCFADASIASVEAAEYFALRPLHVGFDMDKNMEKMIQNGRLDATVMQDPNKIGQVAVESMIKVLESKHSLPKIINIPAILITSDTLKSIK